MSDNKPGSDIQQAYKEYVNQKRFAELAKLIENTETKPAEYIVRMGFKTYMEQDQGNRVKLFSIMKLKEITGIKPDKNVMRHTCEIALEMDSPEVIETLIKRIEIEKNVFQEMSAALQKIYHKYVTEGRFVDISRLMELTDTQASDDIIQKGYEYYIAEGKFISFAGLRKRTGIAPDETMIQDTFREYYANFMKFKRISQDKAEEWRGLIKKLKRISKIAPQGFNIEDLEEKAAEPPDQQQEE
jgi:hypothetical protein